MSLLTKSDGSAFDANSLGIWFADAIERAGLAEACVMHGLRKTAARALAEAGCTAHQIASITGHKSLTEVERYTKVVDQKRMEQLRFIGWSRTQIELRVANASVRDWQTRGWTIDMTM